MKNLLEEIYQLLSSRYGDLRWRPADTPFEVMVGAILTQNTAWTNVEKAGHQQTLRQSSQGLRHTGRP